MLKSMVVILAMFSSVCAHATLVVGDFPAVQDQKAVSMESQPQEAQLLDLNEGY